MNEKILALDDEPLVLSTIEKALSRVGYAVRTASDEKGFVEALRAGSFPLLIMDAHLGGDTEIAALIAEARKVSPGSKILLVSGSKPAIEGEHFLEKPFTIEELRKKVREILDGPS
jgi:two-component system cell cycle sensor histidine kinase/response regulator CckA